MFKKESNVRSNKSQLLRTNRPRDALRHRKCQRIVNKGGRLMRQLN